MPAHAAGWATKHEGFTSLRLLGAVTAAGLLASVHTQCVASSTYNVVSHAWQVTNSSTTHQHNRVLLQVVTLTGNVDRDFFAIGQTNPSDLPQCRVGLFRSHGPNLDTYPLLLRAFLQHDRFGRRTLDHSIAFDQLINCWHVPFSGLNFNLVLAVVLCSHCRYQRWGSNPHVLADTGF